MKASSAFYTEEDSKSLISLYLIKNDVHYLAICHSKIHGGLYLTIPLVNCKKLSRIEISIQKHTTIKLKYGFENANAV